MRARAGSGWADPCATLVQGSGAAKASAWVLSAVLPCALGGCSQGEPPGAEPNPNLGSIVVEADGELDAGDEGGSVPSDLLGTLEDNLPFQPTGKRIASIAWRTWVYTDTGPKRTRLGYLRAGAVVDAREPGLGPNEGCAGGWFRINPRGFVCIGKGATEDVEHDPVVIASEVRPVRGQGFPYLYAMSGEVAPLLYFKLPTMAQMVNVEGDGVAGRASAWKQMSRINGTADLLGPISAPPRWLLSNDLTKPYGVEQPLRYSVHAGKAKADSGFAIARTLEHEGRTFGLTTELDLIALDRVKMVKPSSFSGVHLTETQDLPAAIIDRHYVQRYEAGEDGKLRPSGSYSHRQGLALTGKKQGTGGLVMYETADGSWVPSDGVRLIPHRTEFPSFATGGRKWIDISIKEQSLVAYEGRRPVFVTLVSTGRGGLGDPEKVHATVRGTFMVHTKHVSATMDGDDDKTDSFNLRDVPFVQYFHKGYALHGTYWHDEFGKVRSHGCVNLSPKDSAWLFEWTDPPVPKGWHGVLNHERGTVVYVRP
ncbi:MAG: L,D-transpeptidase [Polyangiaceae bacterium]|nr:L,D-transpeptidase [Polyangiaceae bacterium]MCW5790591.1 L,D-transpeptidase [Polyangiaceae bacterium]